MKKTTKKKATKRKTLSARGRREKGRKFEEKIVREMAFLSDHYGQRVARGSQDTTEHRNADVMVYDGNDEAWLLCECKDGVKADWRKAIRQGADKMQYHDTAEPVAITHDLGSREIFCHVRLAFFLDLVACVCQLDGDG